MDHLQKFKKKVMIMGDFNIKMFDKKSKKLDQLIKQLGYFQIVKAATRGANLLDLILINFETETPASVIDNDLSDHYMTSFSLDFVRKPKEWKKVMYRNFKSLDWRGVVEFLQNHLVDMKEFRSKDFLCIYII